MSFINGMTDLLSTQRDRKLLATLLVQLEEVEEQIEGLQQSRLELLEKISSESIRNQYS